MEIVRPRVRARGGVHGARAEDCPSQAAPFSVVKKATCAASFTKGARARSEASGIPTTSVQRDAANIDESFRCAQRHVSPEAPFVYRAERRVTDSETLGEKSSLFSARRYTSSAPPRLGRADIVVASETFARIIIMCDSIVVFFSPTVLLVRRGRQEGEQPPLPPTPRARKIISPSSSRSPSPRLDQYPPW